MLHVPSGISTGYDPIREEAAFIQMKGSEVFKRAVGTLDSIARETLANHGIDKKEVSWLIPRGELLLFEGFGAGFTWGSALVRY